MNLQFRVLQGGPLGEKRQAEPNEDILLVRIMYIMLNNVSGSATSVRVQSHIPPLRLREFETFRV